MNGDGARRPRSLGELIARTRIPPNTVGLFWPGGDSMVFKSARQRIYLLDPSQACWAGSSRIGAIDIRPDLVFCALGKGPDLPTVRHLATAFPEARFAGSAKSRDCMVGRLGEADWDEVPIDPGRVHALEHEARLDVRQVGISDGVRIRVLNEVAGGHSWNLLFSFAGLQVCVVHALSDDAAVEALSDAIRRKIDVLLWALHAGSVDAAGKVLHALRPGYAIPIGYDPTPKGREDARKFRETAARAPGVKTYLFAEDFMEGLLYSRITSRRRSFS